MRRFIELFLAIFRSHPRIEAANANDPQEELRDMDVEQRFRIASA